jgi:DNA-3-methyladenine glycosylase
MNRRRLADLLDGPVEETAPNLLGLRLRTDFGGITEVEITEVEAYAGTRDPASHAYRGRTQRNASMFEPQGTIYVYRSYGVHWCMNIVTGDIGDPAAVLIRGGTPRKGLELMMTRRRRQDHIADGPGKLTQALGVGGEHDGTNVFEGPVLLLNGNEVEGRTILATPRIGINKAVDWPWRFVLVE